MRFVVSLLALRPGRIGGTEQWLRGLLASLPAALGGDEVVVVAGRDAAAAVDTPGLRRFVVDAGDAELVRRRVLEAFTPWRDRELEDLFAGLGADAVFFPQISMFPRRVAAPAALMVGDVQHLVVPRSIRLADRAFRRAIYPYSLERARVVMAMSERTRRDLVERAGIPDAKIRVVRPGCPPVRDRSAIPRPDVPGPYLYFPAASHPHKGHDELLRAFAFLVAARVPLRLVLTGQKTSHWRRIERQARSLGIGERVVHLGYVDAATVESLYAHAAAVVFPSRFEGFGLPLVEAASVGARVIASRLEVFDENGTEGVHRIDFSDGEQLRAALASTTRARLAEPAWSAHDSALAVVSALREAAGA